MKKMNVESFNLDHTKVAAPYIRLASTIEGEQGDTIYKYDLRFTQPNVRHMDMPSIHSLEHLMAEISRNYSDRIVDISPMGCQTGYYLSILNENDTETIFTLIENVLEDVLRAKEVPACNVVQCGWAESHSLEGAQQLASDMLKAKEAWHIIFQEE